MRLRARVRSANPNPDPNPKPDPDLNPEPEPHLVDEVLRGACVLLVGQAGVHLAGEPQRLHDVLVDLLGVRGGVSAGVRVGVRG